jgi:outer membrane immunogenic protein
MKRILITVVLSIVVAGSALAADLPQPGPPPPEAPAAYVPTLAPVYNWGGIYYGINGGYGIGSSDWTVTAPSASTGDFNVSGFLVGPTVGANFQTDAFVFGIEGDYDASWMQGTSSACTPNNCETKNTWLATVRARVGYAADRVLFYGTAGGAFGNISTNLPGSGNFTSSTEPGWTAGAGVEAAFADNWTARIEYLYVDLENASQTVPVTTGTIKFDTNLIRLGVDYKFR